MDGLAHELLPLDSQEALIGRIAAEVAQIGVLVKDRVGHGVDECLEEDGLALGLRLKVLTAGPRLRACPGQRRYPTLPLPGG